MGLNSILAALSALVVTFNVTFAQSFAIDLLKKNRIVPACKEAPSIVTKERGRGLTYAQLPKGLFIARTANHYGEAKVGSETIKMHGFQNFMKLESRVLCASVVDKKENTFAITAPALIDTTTHKSTGDSLWQYQMSANSRELGIWNKRSMLLRTAVDNMKFYPVMHEDYEYELVIPQYNGQSYEVIIVRYDFLPEV